MWLLPCQQLPPPHPTPRRCLMISPPRCAAPKKPTVPRPQLAAGRAPRHMMGPSPTCCALSSAARPAHLTAQVCRSSCSAAALAPPAPGRCDPSPAQQGSSLASCPAACRTEYGASPQGSQGPEMAAAAAAAAVAARAIPAGAARRLPALRLGEAGLARSELAPIECLPPLGALAGRFRWWRCHAAARRNGRSQHSSVR